jgi:transcriptional regulator with XRE-family HTH domain
LKASLEELEAKSGISKSSWSRYFNERFDPGGETLEKIAQSLVVPQHTIQKWIMMRRENKKEVRSTCRSPSSRSMIAKNSKYSENIEKSMKTKEEKIGWVTTSEAVFHLKRSVPTLKARRERGDFKEGVHYRIYSPESSKIPRYEYHIEAIRELQRRQA